MKAQLIQLAELADRLDSIGLKEEANKIDNFIKEAMRAEVESGMDMLLTNMLLDMSPSDILNKIKTKIDEIRGKDKIQTSGPTL